MSAEQACQVPDVGAALTGRRSVCQQAVSHRQVEEGRLHSELKGNLTTVRSIKARGGGGRTSEAGRCNICLNTALIWWC